PIADLQVISARDARGAPIDDIAHLSVLFADGSTAVIHYLANGAKSFPKERIECFWDGRSVTIDNWRKLHRFGISGPWYERARAMDKGHSAEVQRWMAAVRQGGPSPIPLDELMEVSRWSIRAGALARAEQAG